VAIEKARNIFTCGYINHTDFFTLRDQPIALSIETKALTSQHISSLGGVTDRDVAICSMAIS
jgi:hypothetical protein